MSGSQRNRFVFLQVSTFDEDEHRDSTEKKLFPSEPGIKGEVSRKFAVISKPKCLSVSRNKEIIVKFVINYHPSAIELSISASGQRQSRPVWIET